MKRKRTASENEGDYVKVGDLLFAKLTAEKRWMYSVSAKFLNKRLKSVESAVNISLVK